MYTQSVYAPAGGSQDHPCMYVDPAVVPPCTVLLPNPNVPMYQCTNVLQYSKLEGGHPSKTERERENSTQDKAGTTVELNELNKYPHLLEGCRSLIPVSHQSVRTTQVQVRHEHAVRLQRGTERERNGRHEARYPSIKMTCTSSKQTRTVLKIKIQ